MFAKNDVIYLSKPSTALEKGDSFNVELVPCADGKEVVS